MLITTGVLLAAYLIVYAVTLLRNMLHFKEQTFRAKSLFVMNTIIMILLVVAGVLGVYSPAYVNGPAFIFFVGLANLYTWALLYLNWPVGMEEL